MHDCLAVVFKEITVGFTVTFRTTFFTVVGFHVIHYSIVLIRVHMITKYF